MEDEHHIYKNHSNIRFLRANRKQLLLIYDNFIFKRINGKYPRTTWKCTKGCGASVITISGVFKTAKQLESHNSHPSVLDDITLLEADMRMKQRVQTEFNLTPRQIHAHEREQLMLRNDGTHLRMNSFTKKSSSLYRYRRETFPKNPKSRNEIMLDDDWHLTLDRSEKFVLADDGIENKIMIFGTESNLRILCDAEFVVSDGTFSVHPDLFAQFYVIHAPYLGKVLPLMFCLLPDKSYNTYCRLLEIIKNEAKLVGCNFNPKKIHIDYEIAMIKAVSQVFSRDTVQGCLFHYSQCLWRKVQELGIATAYKNNKYVKQWIRRFSAIPFLPVNDIDNAWIEITENSPRVHNDTITNEQILKFHDYMLNTWIHDSEALFNRNIWSQHNNKGPRTTNNAEGWNNKLNLQAQSRLSFFQFIHFLQKIQVDLDAQKFDLIAASPSRRQNKYAMIDESIATAKTNYLSGRVPLLSFLDSVSCVLKVD